MRKALALVLLAAVSGFAVQIALASGGDSTNAEAQTPSVVPTEVCTPLKQIYARKNWRNSHPARGLNVCPGPAAKLKEAFHRWRVYRLLTPYSGCSGGGKWLRYTAIPGDVVERESGCSWTSVNSSSGACSPYQFIGWTSCDSSSWADKMRIHRTARYVLRVQGPGAWSAW